jgi:cytochrome d ubiquinol oxidase subunit II
MGEPSVAAIVWFILLGFILALYVMLDGFDMGVGILSLLIRQSQRRTVLMSSLSTVWDANEAWLVIWAGALFGAFPLAYATSISALYFPVTLLLFSLIFRGISFEFHSLARRKRIWGLAFGLGSLGAAIAEGMILGGVLSGIRVDSRGIFSGRLFDWLTWTTVVVTVEVVTGFAMLGASYLVLKTEGELQETVRKMAVWFSLGAFLLAAVTAFFLPSVNPGMAARLLVGVRNPALIGIFLVSSGLFVVLLVSLYLRKDRLPFACALLVFFVTFSALWWAEYPYLLPGSITISMAAARPDTLIFMLIGIGPFIPIILAYNYFIYRVFRGKVQAGY